MHDRPITFQELRRLFRSRRVLTISALNAVGVIIFACGVAFIMGLANRKQAHAERAQLRQQRAAHSSPQALWESGEPESVPAPAPPQETSKALGSGQAMTATEEPLREYPVEVRNRRRAPRRARDSGSWGGQADFPAVEEVPERMEGLPPEDTGYPARGQ